MHAASSRLAQRLRARVRRRSGRVDVVDHARGSWHIGSRGDAAANVPAAFVQGQPSLTREHPSSLEHVEDRELPEPPQLRCKRARRHLAALPRALGIAWHGEEVLDSRTRDDLGHEYGGLAGKPASPSLLPGAHEGTRALVIDDRRSRCHERQPPARALRAAAHGPGPGGSATLAHGRNEPGQRAPARGAERATWQVADRAPLGQHQIEHVHASDATPTRVTTSCRVRVRSATPRRARGGRPGHARDRPAS
jgi:hypothetical protein